MCRHLIKQLVCNLAHYIGPAFVPHILHYRTHHASNRKFTLTHNNHSYHLYSSDQTTCPTLSPSPPPLINATVETCTIKALRQAYYAPENDIGSLARWIVIAMPLRMAESANALSHPLERSDYEGKRDDTTFEQSLSRFRSRLNSYLLDDSRRRQHANFNTILKVPRGSTDQILSAKERESIQQDQDILATVAGLNREALTSQQDDEFSMVVCECPSLCITAITD